MDKVLSRLVGDMVNLLLHHVRSLLLMRTYVLIASWRAGISSSLPTLRCEFHCQECSFMADIISFIQSRRPCVSAITVLVSPFGVQASRQGLVVTRHQSQYEPTGQYACPLLFFLVFLGAAIETLKKS